MIYRAVVVTLTALAQAAFGASNATDPRICRAEPIRDESGQIARSKAVLRAYQKLHPCPSTARTTGKCPGWALDHVIPLVCGGCDRVENLQWLPIGLNSCAGTLCKDRWERAINCVPLELPK